MSSDYVGYSAEFLAGYYDGSAEDVDPKFEYADYLIGYSMGKKIRLVKHMDPPQAELYVGFLDGASDFRFKKPMNYNPGKSHPYAYGYIQGFCVNSNSIEFNLGDFHGPEPEPVTEPPEEPSTEPDAEPVTEPDAEPSTEPVAEPAAEPVTEPATEPVTEPVAEPVAEPEAEPQSQD